MIWKNMDKHNKSHVQSSVAVAKNFCFMLQVFIVSAAVGLSGSVCALFCSSESTID